MGSIDEKNKVIRVDFYGVGVTSPLHDEDPLVRIVQTEMTVIKRLQEVATPVGIRQLIDTERKELFRT